MLNTAQRHELRVKLLEQFDLEKIKTLYYSLGITPDQVQERAQLLDTLLFQTNQSSRLAELAETVFSLQPNLHESLMPYFFPPALEIAEVSPSRRSPYKGLQVFREEDAPIFFGREALSDELFTLLQQKAFLAVVGASGSGKSSVVRAGLVPKVKAKTEWRVVLMSPSSDPLAILCYVLNDALSLKLQSAKLTVSELVAALADQTVLLVVDQFEELFTQCKDADKRSAFLACLLGAAPPLRVVLTLRADFLGHCTEQAYHGLAQRIEQHHKLLTHLTHSTE